MSAQHETYVAGMAFAIVLGFLAIFAAVVVAAVYCWYVLISHAHL